MTPLSDAALAHLASVTDRPVVPGDRYEIKGRLGQGGMGTVYLARDHLLDRDVALKALSAPWVAESGDRLLKEAKVLAALEHPGIVPVHDVGRLADGRAFYTMRLVQGQRLDKARAAEPSLAELLRTFYRVCETVAYAHANGILHRDIKPQNIMLGPFGEVLLIDWGVAAMLRAGEAVTDGAVGTRGYMAPEQAAGEAGTVDERTDVYALARSCIFCWKAGRRSPKESHHPIRPVPRPVRPRYGPSPPRQCRSSPRGATARPPS